LLIHDKVEKFVDEECIPAGPIYNAQGSIFDDQTMKWSHPQVLDDLKAKAKKLGLWNMFLAKGHYAEGAGFTNVEYGLMCERFGRSQTASEVFPPFFDRLSTEC